jgi:Amt family ammonium transporter
VVFSVRFFDRLKIDDPVGAISVHGVCGAWGTIAVGCFKTDAFFNLKNIGVQVLGCVAAFFWSFFVAYAFFKLIDFFLGLRVSAEEEFQGLDYSEHAAGAYPDFHVSSFR